VEPAGTYAAAEEPDNALEEAHYTQAVGVAANSWVVADDGLAEELGRVLGEERKVAEQQERSSSVNEHWCIEAVVVVVAAEADDTAIEPA